MLFGSFIIEKRLVLQSFVAENSHIYKTSKNIRLSKKGLAARNAVSQKDLSIALANIAIDALQEVKGVDIVLLDLRDIPEASADFFVICNGTSGTHISGLADRVQKNVWEQMGEHPTHIEGRQGRNWLLLDFFTVVVHIFDNEKRAFYDLEGLWRDAKVTRYENS